MTLEICVDDIAGLDAAIAGGADRIELCAALALGGLTPPPSLIAAAASAPIPVHLLARPREGGFHYTARELAMIAGDITAAAEAGLAGVVIGATHTDHRLDTETLASLVAHARSAGTARRTPLSLTLHRAIDLCADMPAALDAAIALGFDRVLTSGGAPKAIDGLDMLATLQRRAGGRIVILAGSGIDADNVAAFLDVGIVEIHASCGTIASDLDEVADAEALARERRFGFTTAGQRRTDIDRVRALKAVLTDMLHQAA
ncbi:copper homeostasis protein CutC [Sphingomonas sp. PP-CE-3A-406]|uniref:copper homeostasis protein CutC n=1 Tax=Sphingomonas sp. PP-CE-3A-406 TaxID=2135659 RepID=UPI000EF979B7|nr:copper homeostasis protein CutC [Sphingomonas sp. PP-CE-3A-406]RMB54550.1 copper homeostasis protein CutC [Sphingomonas sp. PP-CE-3A-406]